MKSRLKQFVKETGLERIATIVTILCGVVLIPYWAAATETRLKTLEDGAATKDTGEEAYRAEMRQNVQEIKVGISEIHGEMKVLLKKDK